MNVINTNPKRQNRSAFVIAEVDNMVLYDAMENGQVFSSNCVRPSDKFWNEYTAR